MTSSPALREDERDRIDAEARDWARRLATSDSDDPAFRRWRDSDPRHEEAFWDAWRVWQAAGQIGASDENWRTEAAHLSLAHRAPLVRLAHSRIARFGIPAALAASIAAAVFLPAAIRQPSLDVTTPVGVDRVVALADGSRVTVGARSGIKAYISGGKRLVELTGGQAFFEVAHDASRPFIVKAGDAEIRVTGTKFDVHRIGDDVRVAVLEGRVEVRHHSLLSMVEQTAPDQVLTKGRMSELHGDESFGPTVAAPVTPGSWRSGRVYYTDTPLGDILLDAERYSNRSLRVADDQLAETRISASFRPGNLDSLINNIQAALPLVAHENPDGSVIFVRKAS